MVTNRLEVREAPPSERERDLTHEPGVTRLVRGIIEDVQELFKGQLDLFQAEIQDDIRQTKDATVIVAAGGLVLLLGGIFLGLMCVHLLHDVAELPMWGSFLIVGSVMIGVGLLLYMWGQDKFSSFNPLPDKSVAALKETLHGRVRDHQTTDGNPA
jgi:hypothetical protein